MVQPTGSTAYEPVTENPVPTEETPQGPPSRPPRRWRKWWARFLVLVFLAGAVLLFLWVREERTTVAARIDLETVRLTAQEIPVETSRTGDVIAVDVEPQQRVEEGDRLGTLEYTTVDSDGDTVQRRINLTAPRDGIVVEEPAPVGSTVQAGEPFVRMYDPTQMTFVTDVPLEDLPEIAPGMTATLTAQGMDREVEATVQRVVPKLDTDDPTRNRNSMRMVLVPADEQEVVGLVPGLRFTGFVDTRTGGDQPTIVS